MDVIVTIVDTAGVQDYIFSSNRLRENIGASYLVEQATRNWVYEALDEIGEHNVLPKSDTNDDERRIARGQQIETHNLAAELIYAGGGNTTILFRSLDEAKEFSWNLSKHVLEDAPGLYLVIAHSQSFAWQRNSKDLYEQIKNLRDGRLADKKRTRQTTPTSLLGLGVTAECEATGLVATRSSDGWEPEARLVSRETIAKLKAAKDEAKNRLRNLFRDVDPEEQIDFSDELDHLGRKGGEESYIAVVHIDGNAMGDLFNECGTKAASNGDYINSLRELSEGVDAASREALKTVLRRLKPLLPRKGEKEWVLKEQKPSLKKIDDRAIPKQIEFFRDKKKTNNKPRWPFRPLVYGGDDVTFVCNGQLGLSLAKIYMDEFAKQTLKLLKQTIHTGAGVCIVKVHYPFRRAYDVSVALTKSAKTFLGDDKPKASALDWHISTTGLSGELRAIRRQEYQVSEGSLLMRPMRLAHDSDWRIWENFNLLVARFNFDKDWAGRRNKLKALREVMRGGAKAVQEYLAINQLSSAQDKSQNGIRSSLPELKNDGDRSLHKVGWESGHCVYFDALEAMDHHFLLEEVKDGDAD